MTEPSPAVPISTVFTEIRKIPPCSRDSMNFYESGNLLRYPQELVSRPHIQQEESTAPSLALVIESQFTIIFI
jgi:hypothetical protein